MTFDDALDRSREAYALGQQGWLPKFTASQHVRGFHVGESWGRGEWASYRLGQRDRERALALIRNPALDTRRASL